ncbi:MFS transporter [Cupriavidus sp. WKF15]|uniref:MFS transporter n=1 Tax=Cupriavidus sp. WKF15 TaxID=3032282 RepID=UPI0023E2AE43|nr:MFS transporter [Cupriavidus sp. WKF15]WER50783.1 MFS transporter [Cupriavidus sp. WKF15]
MSVDTGNARRAAAGAFIGTTIEFYDFYVYATAAALVLGQLFFPGDNVHLSTLAAFGTFAVGFIARPLAGVVFGHLGDRLGRKKMLLVTMGIMGAATTGIGLLPTYAAIGYWAPVGLIALRLLQGISVGGEWGGAVLMASENAPAGKKTFYASFAQLGSPAGLLLTLIVFRLVSLLSEREFLAWGWRIPFLVGSLLMLAGLYIRSGVRESAEFAAVIASRDTARFPIAEVVRDSWREIVCAALAVTIGTAGFFFTNTFMISYVTQYLGISRAVILDCLFVVTIAQFVSQPASAWLAQKVGETRFLKAAAGLCILAPYPMFWMVCTKNVYLMTAGIALSVVLLSAVYAVIAGYITQIFPARVRYSGISLSYQLCSALASGTAPVVGALLAERYAGQWTPLAIFFSLLSVLSLLGICGLAKLNKGRHLVDADEPVAQPKFS